MQRVSKTYNDHQQRYLWQQGLLDAKIDMQSGKEHLSRRYIYVGLKPIAVIDYDEDNTASIYSIHTDHLGTPQQVSNDKQQIISQNKTEDSQAKQKGWSLNLMNAANAAEATADKLFEFNLRFAGQYEDGESGYYYNWHRYDNPETGRYITSDPIGLNWGLNTYGYAGGNPVQALHPWGLSTIVDENYKVIEAYADGDKNIYIRQKFMCPDKRESGIQTMFDDEFISPESGTPYEGYQIKVDFNFDSIIEDLADEAIELNLIEIAARS